MLDHLLDRAVSWLRVAGLVTRGLAVQLCYGDYQRAQGRTALTSGTALELAGRLPRDRDNFLLRTPCLTR
jgi:hypothetical protein